MAIIFPLLLIWNWRMLPIPVIFVQHLPVWNCSRHVKSCAIRERHFVEKGIKWTFTKQNKNKETIQFQEKKKRNEESSFWILF